MRIATVSASSYETYSWCEWQYYLQYVLGYRSEAGPAALMGTMAHEVLELLGRANIGHKYPESKVWNLDYLWRIVYNHFQNSDTIVASQIETAKLNKICRGVVETIKSEWSPTNPRVMSVELPFSLPIKEPAFYIKQSNDQPVYLRLTGRIDRIDKIDDNTLEIIDYKTGSRVNWGSKDRDKIDEAALYEKIQPRLYHLAAKQLFPNVKNFLVTFIYLADGGPVTVPFTDADADTTLNIIKRRFQAMVANNDPQQDRSWKCTKMCWFGKTGLCNQIWDEKEQLGLQTIEDKYQVLNNVKRYI